VDVAQSAAIAKGPVMPTGHVYIATSLDGFVARDDHGLDWLMKFEPGEGDGDMGFAAFTESIDGLIMGRGTFEMVLGFGAWPYKKHVIVLSSSLASKDVPEHLAGQVEIWNLEPSSAMDRLGEMGWSRVYVDGGRLVQSFLRAGLIDDLVITVAPVLIGSGKRLFGALHGDLDLELLECRAFSNGMVQNHYRIKKRRIP
jgi:dihydrofolate reductase